MNSDIKIIAGIVLFCVLVLGVFVYFSPRAGDGQVVSDLSVLVRAGNNMTGKMGAKVTVVEYADYQCPACASVSPFIKLIADIYKDNPDFNFVYRHFPLSQHANAVISAEAAEAADDQGKFWEMSEMLYKGQAEWEALPNPTEVFVSYAKTLGLDTIKFRNDLTSGKFRAVVESDLQDAITLQLNKTPSVFLNGREVSDLNTLKNKIDDLLQK
jgi:protein-disulfide isomerase